MTDPKPFEEKRKRGDDWHDSRFASIEAQLAAGTQRMDGLQSGQEAMQATQQRMQEELTKNTVITTEIRELLDMAKSGLKVIGGIGNVVAWVVKKSAYLAGIGLALWSAYYTITHNGQLPPKP